MQEIQLKHFIKPLIWLISLFIIYVSLFSISNIFINHSNSIKLGRYISLPYYKPIKGNTYIICLTNSGYLQIMAKLGLPKGVYCKNGYESLLKRVIGIPGDNIIIESDGMYLNGELVKNSIATNTYNGINLHPLAIGYMHTLQKNEYLIIGDSVKSFDSRYFGVISSEEISSRAIFIGDLN